jgi:Cd2+/Zn2+-exporting ATPase
MNILTKAYKTEIIEAIGKKKAAMLLAGTLLFLAGILFKFPFEIELGLFLASYILVGGDIIIKAVKNIVRGNMFDENSLMSIATIGAFAIGELPEGVAVMLFYQVGEMFQDMAVSRSRKSIRDLMDIRPDYANLKTDGGTRRVAPEEVSPGDIVIVKPGEKVPLDGRIIDGKSMVDTSSLTGESMPVEVGEGDELLSGSINNGGLLTIEITRKYSESTAARILELVQEAGTRKAPAENFITRFARYYTPVVVFTALALAIIPPLVIPGAALSVWLYRALVFLVISCPCALVISIPLGYFGGIGGASGNGILVKGGNILDALNNIHTVVFDKTGTITKGKFSVTKIQAENGFTEEELLEYAAHAESYSSHPIAMSILEAYGRNADKDRIESHQEIPGQGVKVKVGGSVILAGNKKLMNQENIICSEREEYGTVVHVAVDGKYAGFIVISDEIKEDSFKAVKALRDIGINRLVMLTGDALTVGAKVGQILGLDEVYAELLPHQKVEKLEELEKKKNPGGKLAFIGDGINDAPVLARADIGVAMGGLGSDAAIEAADVVLMTDELSKLVTAVRIAKRTKLIVWQNIFLALIVKSAVMLLGAGGIATMWEAVFADVGVALLAILNAMRVLKVRNI